MPRAPADCLCVQCRAVQGAALLRREGLSSHLRAQRVSAARSQGGAPTRPATVEIRGARTSDGRWGRLRCAPEASAHRAVKSATQLSPIPPASMVPRAPFAPASSLSRSHDPRTSTHVLRSNPVHPLHRTRSEPSGFCFITRSSRPRAATLPKRPFEVGGEEPDLRRAFGEPRTNYHGATVRESVPNVRGLTGGQRARPAVFSAAI